MTKKELLIEMQNRRDIGEYVGSEQLLCIFNDDEKVSQTFIDLMLVNPNDYKFSFKKHEYKKQFKKELKLFIKKNIN